jgi:hypothetical protein
MASISKGKKAGMKKSIGGLFDQRTPISLIKLSYSQELQM